MHLEQSQGVFHVMRWQRVMMLTVLERHGAGWVGGLSKRESGESARAFEVNGREKIVQGCLNDQDSDMSLS